MTRAGAFATFVVAGLALIITASPVDAQDGTIIDDGPRLEVIAPVSPLPAKERVNVFLEVVNLGPGEIRNLSVFIQPADGSGLIVVGQLVRGMENIPEGGSDLLVVRVATPATAGGGSLLLRFTYTGPDGQTIVRERVTNVQIAPPISDPLEVTFGEEPLPAGEPANLTLFFRNPARSEIRDLDVTLTTDTEQGALLRSSVSVSPGNGSSLVVQGSRLPPGAGVRLDVPVLTRLEPNDLLEFTLTARYTLEGFAREQIFEFGARVIGGVNIRVLDAREVRTPDGLEIAATIVNVGSGTAWNPRVDVPEASGLRTDGPIVIEDLEPNEAVDVRIPVERVAEGDAGAPLFEIDWNDEYGNIVQPRPVEGRLMQAAPESPSRLGTLWGRALSLPAAFWLALAIALVVVAVVAALLVRAARRRGEAEGVDAAPAQAPVAPTKEGEDEWDEEERQPWWQRRRKQKPKGKSGARPGG